MPFCQVFERADTFLSACFLTVSVRAFMEIQSTHGGDTWQKEVRYDFSININPLGMPEAAYEAAMQGLALSSLYPDIRAFALTAAAAQAFSVRPEQILAGNGAAELIYALLHSLYAERKGEDPIRAYIPSPQFQMYEEALYAVGGVLEEDIKKADFAALSNPNNPTGAMRSRRELLAFVEEAAAGGTLVLLDESFLPFSEEEDRTTLLPFLNDCPNLLILRSFTKIFAMAGLRLGCVMSSDEELLFRMRRQMQPWNTSIPAQMAGCAALSDKDFLRRTREQIASERSFLYNGLKACGVKEILPGHANFFLFRADADLGRRLLKESGILIRDCSDFRGLSEGWFRIAVRNHHENEELIRSVRALMRPGQDG